MPAKQKHDHSTILHVRVPAGLKARLKLKATGASKTLGALVTELILAGLQTPKDWTLGMEISRLKIRLGSYKSQVGLLHMLVESHRKRMRAEGKDPDNRLIQTMSFFKKHERRMAKQARSAAKRRRRERDAARGISTRPLAKVFNPMSVLPETLPRVDDLTVYDWRWLSLSVALDDMSRGQLGKFAAAVGIPPSMLSRYRSSRTASGHRRIPEAVAQRMAKVLGISPTVFDKWDQQKAPFLRLGKSIDSLLAILHGLPGLASNAVKKRAPAGLTVENRVLVPFPKRRASIRSFIVKRTQSPGADTRRAPQRLFGDDLIRR